MDTSTTPGFSPTSKATSPSGSGGVQNTPQTYVTPKPGQAPSTQANNTPTTGQPATNPTTVVPTQAPAPKAFYSFEGSAQGWSGESCDVQGSAQYAYAGANSLEAKNIASYSYAYAYAYGATISQGETITFYVYVPAGSSSVSADVYIDAVSWS
ncbi:hypothetical protein [Ktedonobacter sp. SOSP1-52]|uniref:hypothetical protein n=1 Tax=Ktedonobacter sp. SOSP1-52 TaxID=2778366 RepID=UPI001916BC6F|nr:hypothetical protein [Ktedonobacter sp. SOSP1-52]